MIGRYLVSIAIGVVVTLSLLFIMQLLIATGEAALTKPRDRTQLDFVRVKRDENLDTEDFEPEKPPLPPEVPPEMPPQSMDSIDPTAPSISISAPEVSADTELSGPGGMNVAEGDFLPIVRVAPVYPARALARGVEGYVDMSFTVTLTGTVENPVVLYSTNSLFDRSAIQAVLRFKYKPRVVDGVPVAVPNVKTRISFRIEE
jgi:protein TonB